MNERNFFMNSKMGSELLIMAAGEKVNKALPIIPSCYVFHTRYLAHAACLLNMCILLFFNSQTGGYTNANYIWDLMRARNIYPSLAAVEAYYQGLKVSYPSQQCILLFMCFEIFSYLLEKKLYCSTLIFYFDQRVVIRMCMFGFNFGRANSDYEVLKLILVCLQVLIKIDFNLKL